MKWLAALLACGATIAAAEVVMLPRIVTTCGTAAKWDVVAACLAKHGDVKIERDVADAKLVRLATPKQPSDGAELGVYLFVQRDHKWQIGGMYEAEDPYDIGAFSPLTINHHTGWRIDLDLRMTTTVQVGDAATPAILDRRVAVFCPADGFRCFDVMTACDVLIHGKSYWSFRGKLELEGTTVHNTGDRSNAGAMCEAPREVNLFWPAS